MSDNCTNASGASVVCYQILPSSQLITSIWLSAIGGLLCLIGFVYLRGSPTWRNILHKRATQIPELLFRPPPLRLTGLYRIWSWLIPVFTLSDADLITTAGLDPLMLIRFIQLGIQMFLPFTFVGASVLLPVYSTAGGLASSNSTANTNEFMLQTMSNIPRKSERIWAPVVVMLVGTAWCLFCLWCHSRSYAALRLLHIRGGGLLRELGLASDGDTSSLQGVMHIVGTYGKNTSAKDNGEPKSGEKESNGTAVDNTENVKRQRPSGPWRVALHTAWRAANPVAMLRNDIDLVEDTLVGLEAHLAERRRNERRAKLVKAKSEHRAEESCTSESVALKAQKEEPSKLIGDIRYEDWGPAVSAAEIPEAVCPWWLPSEECPASVNPVLQGGGILLGKTPAGLRSRVRAKRGNAEYWAPMASYVVLYRIAGPTQASQWESLQDQFRRLNNDEQEEADQDEGNFDERNESVFGSNSLLQEGGSSMQLGGENSQVNEQDDNGNNSGLQGTSTKPTASERNNSTITDSQKSTKASSRVVSDLGDRGKALERILGRLFPDTFQELMPVYCHKTADKAVLEWDNIAAELAGMETTLENARKKGGEALKIRNESDGSNGSATISADVETGLSVEKVESQTVEDTKQPKKEKKKKIKTIEEMVEEIDRLKVELVAQEAKVLAARAAVFENPLDTAYFALFTSQKDALIASKGHIGAAPDINMTAELAPGPDEVNWEGLWAGWQERWWRTVLFCVIPMVIIVLFPIGPLVGALTNLPTAICGGTPETNSLYWPWLCESGGWQWFVEALFTGILPVFISTFWDTFVMPLLLYLIMQAQRCHASFSALDQAIIKGFFGK